jgi:hypothetical protein
MKNFNDIIGNRTRDLPAYSAMPEPPAPLYEVVTKYFRYVLVFKNVLIMSSV